MAEAIRRHDVDEVIRLLKGYEARDQADYLEKRRDKRLKDAERYVDNILRRGTKILEALQRTREVRASTNNTKARPQS